MSKRIFVAIPASPELQAAAAGFAADHPRLPVRWLAGRNLHVTLLPPWYELLPGGVIEKLRSAEGGGEFDLGFRRVGFGPEPARPRLIWAEGEASVRLMDLKLRIEQALGLVVTLRRPFRLHLTLARFRPEDFPRFPQKELNEQVDWPERVRSFVLMESHLSRGGAEYEILEEFPLA